jgi:hypothetical protein
MGLTAVTAAVQRSLQARTKQQQQQQQQQQGST